jgi:chitodextrinase
MYPKYTLGKATAMLFSKMIVVFLLFTHVTINAQGVNSISVNPTNPNTSSNVTINVEYYLANGCWSMAGASYGWSGNTINIYLNFNYSGSQFCPLVYTTANQIISVGTLVSGTYTVRVWDLDQGSGLLGSTSFFVSSTGCPAPSLNQIFASNATNNSIVLNGPAGFQMTDYQYRLLGSTVWLNVNSTTSNFTTISNLQANTNYEFRISVRCSNGVWSNWSASKTFTTLSNTCPTPPASQLSASSIGTNSITVNAPGGYTGFDIQYRQLGNTTWLDVTGTTGSVLTITGLFSNTTYEIRFSVRCNNGVWSAWSGIRTFTTQSNTNCSNPPLSSVYAANITSNSAIIYGPNSYFGLDIQYRPLGTAQWIDLSSSTNMVINIMGLAPSTVYEYRFSVRCSNGVWSLWSASQTFITSTPSINNGDEACSAFTLTANNTCEFSFFNTQNASISNTPPIPGVVNCPYNSTFDIWIRVTMPSTGKVTIYTQAGSLSDIVVAAYSGTCSNLTYFGCIDDDSQGNTMPNFTITSSSQYVWLRVWGYSSNGSFSLCAQTNFGLTDDISSDLSDTPVNLERQASTSESSINLYPNPTTGLINMDVEGLDEEIVLVSVYDMKGTLQQESHEVKIAAGKANYDIDLSALPNGMYLVKMTGSKTNKIHKITKI